MKAEFKMVKLCLAFVCGFCALSALCGGAEKGLASTGEVVKDINMFVDGAAVVVMVRSPLTNEQLDGFKEVLTLINQGCAAPVRRGDGNNTLPAAVVVFCVDDENEVKRHAPLDRMLENLTIVAPLSYEDFLDKRELNRKSKSIAIFITDNDGSVDFDDASKVSLPLPKRNGSRNALITKSWKDHLANVREHLTK